ncbi:MAG: ribose 5-phosphate isomerase B [Lachnospiraceae bacterium]|nr:ribose 5-phosphate isomerase B [Lachnospiraceae bacterium]
MKIAFASDHAGIEMKLVLMEYLKGMGHECVDYGNYDPDDRDDDYPVYGRKAAEAVMRKEADRGVIICGTGVGISLAANKVPGIRAVVCSEPYSARMARAHNNANMLALGARVIGRELAKMIAETFFTTEFEGGRHERRVEMISEIENDYRGLSID